MRDVPNTRDDGPRLLPLLGWLTGALFFFYAWVMRVAPSVMVEELMRDFIPVAPVNYSDLVLVVYPTVPVTNLAELIALAKSKPGKLNYASSGPGTPYHMAGELFKAMANVDIVHVPYKGSSQARTDVLGGQVDMMFEQMYAAMPSMGR